MKLNARMAVEKEYSCCAYCDWEAYRRELNTKIEKLWAEIRAVEIDRTARCDRIAELQNKLANWKQIAANRHTGIEELRVVIKIRDEALARYVEQQDAIRDLL